MKEFNRSIAVIIGINQYENGIPTLRTAVNDAKALGELLESKHQYEVHLHTDEEVTLDKFRKLLKEFKENQSLAIGSNDRLLFYFAGHGVALDGDDGPMGYVIPQDARRESSDTFLSMHDLHDALASLPCRHFLAILDCCFSGAFRWSSTRHLRPVPMVVYQERYARYILDPAWQVLTSSAHDQVAMDILAGVPVGKRDDERDHSPFARALLEALRGPNDIFPLNNSNQSNGDGVITATELYLYLRNCVETTRVASRQRQTPGIWPLKKHDKGEYIFLVPGHTLNLPAAPPLSKGNNPYRGLEPFEEEHKEIFFGRENVKKELYEKIIVSPLTTVVGTSGAGKSSLVKAGLVPLLRENNNNHWEILPSIRPGASPIRTLADVCKASDIPAFKQLALERLQNEDGMLADLIGAWRLTNPGKYLLMIVDQFEELLTICQDEHSREHSLNLLKKGLREHPEIFRLIITIRSGFEPQFVTSLLSKEEWVDAQFFVTAMTQDELRSAIEGPASARVLYFEPASLVDRLINEVIGAPGALPLLSFTLSELYFKYLQSSRDNRALTQVDYEGLGGVVGSLRNRANEEYVEIGKELGEAAQVTMRRVMLRMVTLESGQAARRRVLLTELEHEDVSENQRINNIVFRLLNARLIVEGGEGKSERYVEPAHDELLRGWDKLWHWIGKEQERLLLQRRMNQAANDWLRGGKDRGQLWDDDPRLLQLKENLRLEENWFNRLETEFVKKSISRKRQRLVRLVATVVTVVVLLTTATVIALIQRREALEKARIATSRQLAAQSLNVLNDRFVLSLLLSVEAVRTEQTIESYNTLLTNLEYSPHVISFLHGHSEAVYSVAFSPDGKLLASGGIDNNIIIWDIATHQPLGQPLNEHTDYVQSLSFSPDGRVLASGGSDGKIIFWDVATHQRIGQPIDAHTDGVLSIAFSPNNKTLASSGSDQTIKLWDTIDHQPLGLPLSKDVDNLRSLTFNFDGKKLISCGADATIRIWDVANRKQMGQPIKGHEGAVRSVAISPDGKTLASGGADKVIRLWEVATGKPLRTPLTGHTGFVRAVVFSPDGKLLASASSDNNLILWDVASGKSICGPPPQKGHRDFVLSLAFSSDNKTLASGGADNAVILWDITRHQNLGQSLKEYNYAAKAAFNPDGQLLALYGKSHSVVLWDTATRKPLGEPITKQTGSNESKFTEAVFSPDSKLLATCDTDNNLILWDVATRQPVGEPLTGGQYVSFSPDGKRLAVYGANNRVFILDVATRKEIGELACKNTEFPQKVVFSPDGKLMASSTDDNTIVIWNILTLEQIGEPLSKQDGSIKALAFSLDSKILASGSDDNTIVFWNVDTRQPIGDPIFVKEIWGGQGVSISSIQGLAFSPDSKILASGSSDRFITLWDIGARQPIGRPLYGHSGEIHNLLFSPDGKTLVSRDLNEVILWDLNIESWQARACRIANRNLTLGEWNLYMSETPYRSTCPSVLSHKDSLQ